MGSESVVSTKHGLELKIPPPIVAALVAGAMWGISRVTAVVTVPVSVRHSVTGLLAVIGFGLAASGVLAFWRAKTTIHPEKPENTRALVSTGIYRVTRNPMYLGILLALTAWGVALAAPWCLAGPVVFVLYIQRFQILPEERVLAAKFGAEYQQYRARVRRWV